MYFFLLSCPAEEGVKSSFGGDLASSQGQPSTAGIIYKNLRQVGAQLKRGIGVSLASTVTTLALGISHQG